MTGREDNRPRGIPQAKQFPFVEDPATVLLLPIHLSGAEWWSYDGVLLGGLKINGTEIPKDNEDRKARVMCLPTPIPRSWGRREFGVVVEYEAEHPDSQFQFRLFYGCGDPSQLLLGETPMVSGQVGMHREKFFLKDGPLERNQLFRFTLELLRKTPHPILIYGLWLELGV